MLLHEQSWVSGCLTCHRHKGPFHLLGEGQEPGWHWWCLCSLSAPHPSFLALSAQAGVCVLLWYLHRVTPARSVVT